MISKISYEDQIEIDTHCADVGQLRDNFYRWNIYIDSLQNLLNKIVDNYKNYKFSNIKVCAKKFKQIINESEESNGNDYNSEVEMLTECMDENITFCDVMIKKGFDNYQAEDVELSEKDKLKLQIQKSDLRLKEIQEENAPYLNFSIGLSLVLISIIFFCIPTFFNTVALYHICGAMLILGIYLLINEINVRSKLGWHGYSQKIASKKAFLLLFQAFVYMIPLSVLFYFFAQILIIKILFFIQVWFCSTLIINGIALLLVTNITKNKEKKFNTWSFICGTITIAAFIIQMLQLFKVL